MNLTLTAVLCLNLKNFHWVQLNTLKQIKILKLSKYQLTLQIDKLLFKTLHGVIPCTIKPQGAKNMNTFKFTDGEIKHSAKKTDKNRSGKLSKAERKKIKAIRKFKRNNDI